MPFLLDTNVISEVRKRRPDSGVEAWFSGTRSGELFLSVLVVGEIRQGVERLRRRDPVQAEPYDAWLAVLVRDFGDRILPVTTEVAEEWGRMNVPDPLPAIDGLMAATARISGLTFVTRNTGALRRTGVDLLNPFAS